MALTAGPAANETLVLRALGLGDLLTGVPALRALRRNLPSGERLVLAAPTALRPLVTALGAVDELVDASGPRAPRWDRPAPRLAVNLHGHGPQSTQALHRLRPGTLWAFHAGPDADVPGATGPRWPRDAHEADRWCGLLEYHGVAADPTDLRLPLPQRAASPAPDAIVVHPGAASGARRWPAERLAAVVRALRADRPDCPIVVSGTGGESVLARRVACEGGLPPAAVLAGRTGLAEYAALIAHARLLICGDTGAAHLATAYGTPSVVLFGPTSPRRWGPRIDEQLHVSLWAGIEGDPHSAAIDPGLERIRTHTVIAAARGLLEATRPEFEGAARV